MMFLEQLARQNPRPLKILPGDRQPWSAASVEASATFDWWFRFANVVEDDASKFAREMIRVKLEAWRPLKERAN